MLTPALISKLKAACGEHLDYLQAQLEPMPNGTEDEQKARRPLATKVESLKTQIDGSETWIKLFGDKSLPADGKCDRVGGCVYLAQGTGWVHPGPPAVVLVIGEPPEEGDGDAAGDGISHGGESSPRSAGTARSGTPAEAAAPEVTPAKRPSRRSELKAKPEPRDG